MTGRWIETPEEDAQWDVYRPRDGSISLSKFGAARIDKKGPGRHRSMCFRRLEPSQLPASVGEQIVDRSTCHDGIVRRWSTPRGCVSYIRTATTPADRAVIPAIAQMAASKPARSATMPLNNAPAANPRSRQKR